MICVALFFVTSVSSSIVPDSTKSDFAITQENNQIINEISKMNDDIDDLKDQLQHLNVDKRNTKYKNLGRRRGRKFNNNRNYAGFSLLSPKDLIENISLYEKLLAFEESDLDLEITQETYNLIQSVLPGLSKLSLQDINDNSDMNKIEISRIFCMFKLRIDMARVYKDLSTYTRDINTYEYYIKHIDTQNVVIKSNLYQYVKTRFENQKRIYVDKKNKFLEMVLEQGKLIDDNLLIIDDNIQ